MCELNQQIRDALRASAIDQSRAGGAHRFELRRNLCERAAQTINLDRGTATENQRRSALLERFALRFLMRIFPRHEGGRSGRRGFEQRVASGADHDSMLNEELSQSVGRWRGFDPRRGCSVADLCGMPES